MYKIVDFINYWGTLVGLIVSVVTMFNTFRLNKKLKYKLDLADLNNEIDIVNAQLDELINFVSENGRLYCENLTNAKKLITKLINKYPNIDKKIIKHLNVCNSFIWDRDISQKISNSSEFLKSLSYVKENLIKEIRP